MPFNTHTIKDLHLETQDGDPVFIQSGTKGHCNFCDRLDAISSTEFIFYPPYGGDHRLQVRFKDAHLILHGFHEYRGNDEATPLCDTCVNTKYDKYSCAKWGDIKEK